MPGHQIINEAAVVAEEVDMMETAGTETGSETARRLHLPPLPLLPRHLRSSPLSVGRV